MEEPVRRSMLDFVKSGKRSETCRLVYFAHLHSPSEDLLKAFSHIVKETFSESITGLLLAYPRHVLHLIEAPEEDVFQLSSIFFKAHPLYLGSTKYFPIQTNVSCRFLDKWYGRKATYHSGEANEKIEKILDDSFENVTMVHKETLFKLYRFYHELKITMEENHMLLMDKLESLYEGGHEVLPNERTVDFILNSQWGESLQSLTKSFFYPVSPKFDEVWPFPEMALPRVDFNEMETTKNALKIKDSATCMILVDTNSTRNMDHAVAGAVSGFVTRFICQPLDVVKIRFQLQVEPIGDHHVSKYRSVLQAFSLIIREEGVHALWKGHVPAQVLSIVYGTGQFYSYNLIVNFSNDLTTHDRWKNSTNFVAGAGAGIVATIVSFPFDTVRTRLVAQSSTHQVYHGVIDCCVSILRTESPKSFFRGLWPTVLQIAPHTSLQFGCYGFFKDAYKKYFDNSSISITNSVLSGSAAGLIAKTIVYPMDLARKRLQIQGFEHGRKDFGKFFRCNGMIHCLVATVSEEGKKGLFKGLLPSQLKAVATTALHFTVYEQALVLLKSLH